MDKSVLEALGKAKVYELGQPFYVGMPRRMSAPPFMFSLIRSHTDTMPSAFTSAAAVFSMGDHTGTHIDAFCHCGVDQKVFGHGEDILKNESYGTGVAVGNIEETPPIIRRGVLLDIPLVRGVDVLGPDDEVIDQDLEAAEKKHGVRVQQGDVVLIRTGWAHYYDSDPHKFNAADNVVPGVGLSAAQWLCDRKIAHTGSDTTAYEKVNKSQLQVHRMMLTKYGVQIMESMNLESLARDRIYEFIFVTLPLPLRGATGSPIRPIALV